MRTGGRYAVCFSAWVECAGPGLAYVPDSIVTASNAGPGCLPFPAGLGWSSGNRVFENQALSYGLARVCGPQWDFGQRYCGGYQSGNTGLIDVKNFGDQWVFFCRKNPTSNKLILSHCVRWRTHRFALASVLHSTSSNRKQAIFVGRHPFPSVDRYLDPLRGRPWLS